MFDMLKAILRDVLGIRALPNAPAAGVRLRAANAAHMADNAVGRAPKGYPFFDRTDLLPVVEDHFGIL